MVTYKIWHCDKRSVRPQVGCFAFMMLLSQVTIADPVCTYIDDECVYEYGDFGKAANQYPLSVGELNVISSTIVTDNGKDIFITKPVNDLPKASFRPGQNSDGSASDSAPETAP